MYCARENDHGRNSERDEGQDRGRAEVPPESVGESREGRSSALGGLRPLDDDRDGGRGSSATDAGSDYRPAMFALSGPAYQGLGPAACDGKALNYPASRLFTIGSGLRRASLPPGHASVSTGNGMPALPPPGECELGVPLEAARSPLPREGTGEDFSCVLPEVRR
jgi:hypothetical protein